LVPAPACRHRRAMTGSLPTRVRLTDGHRGRSEQHGRCFQARRGVVKVGQREASMASGELRSRRAMIESARAAGHALDPLISESWARCETTIAESSDAAPVDAEPDEVRQRWEESPVKRSGVDVEQQLARVAEDGDLVAAVTDTEGRILWSAGGRRMSRIAEQVGFVPGGRWDETSAGTNALAMALVTGQASTVFSAEHWCDAVRDWVCWSVPVH